MSEFDVNFNVLPPKLQLRLWVLALDADTSKVNLAYKPGRFRTSLGYNYGGNLEASLGVRRFSTTVGVNPSSGDFDLGLVFRGFRFGASHRISQRSTGISFGFGSKLLPFPAELSRVFTQAAGSLHTVVGDISAAPDNPLQWYGVHSDDIGTISQAISTGQQINSAAQDPNRFGLGLRLNYAPATGLVIYGGAQYRF